ncbi:MAG: GNAT family N-acetyltransferase [Hyphomonadaceae bacterium]
MTALTYPLFTPRLRLEPVTPELAAAARLGEGAFEDMIGAEAPHEWSAGSLALIGRSAHAVWGPPAEPIRAVLVHRGEECVIGDVRFEPSMRAARQFEIGYSVAKSRRRQGFAVEGAGAVIDWLFDEGGAETIVAGCDMRNGASVRTLRRLGFWLDRAEGQAFWWLLTADLRSAKRA